MEQSRNACSEEGARLLLTNELRKLHRIKNTPRVRQETTTGSLLGGTPNSAQKSEQSPADCSYLPTQEEEGWSCHERGLGKDKGESEFVQGTRISHLPKVSLWPCFEFPGQETTIIVCSALWTIWLGYRNYNQSFKTSVVTGKISHQKHHLGDPQGVNHN